MKNNPLVYLVAGAVLSALVLVYITREQWRGTQSAVETIAKAPEATKQAAVEPKDETNQPEPEPAKPETASPDPAPSVNIVPSFDIVRVEEDGAAVIAGRAAPGAQIMLTLNGETVGEAMANERGEWVVTPLKPLPQGAHNLMIVAKDADGNTQQSDQVVSVAVPETGQEQPLIVLSKPSEASKVLQKPEPAQETTQAEMATEQPQAVEPEPETAAEVQIEQTVAAVETSAAETAAQPEAMPEPAPVMSKPLVLETVDYNDSGDIIFSGKSDAGGTVRIYVDNEHVGDAIADANGQWNFKGNENIAAGLHKLRIDQVGSDGKVAQRRELPFERADPVKVAELQSAQASAEVSTTRSATETPTAETTPSQPVSETAEQQASAGTQTAAVTPETPEAASDQQTTETQTAAADTAAAQPEPATPKVGRVVIQPGNNLWNISRVIYGRGIEYTAIYEANKDQIRNPHRIYPGQIFTTPGIVPPSEIDPKRREPLNDTGQ